MPNLIETAVAMLAATSLGAIWSSCATDIGPAAAIERLKDPELARQMGARGREKARAYTWSRAIDQVERALSIRAQNP